MTSKADKPNVVFILTDDQGPWAARCCGNPEILTPNIDRLAATGVRFENFFCTSPVCSPARASLLTGRIPSQHGVHDWIRDPRMLPDRAQGASATPCYTDGAGTVHPVGNIPYLKDFVCYTDVLATNSYVCGLSGKWHLGESLRPQHGFTHWFAVPGGSSLYNDVQVIRDGRVEIQPGYLTDVITNDALRFIERNKDGAFYLSVHYTAPHQPWTGHPKDIVDSYEDCAFKTCPQEASHPWCNPLMRVYLGSRESLKGYFAAVTAADIGVGRIIDRLEQLGLRENTLIIFSSDNGFSCGHHGFWGKGNGTIPLNMYENSVKVPFIMSHAGRLPSNVVKSALVSQYDFMPTLLDYLGLPPVKDRTLPGVSFVPVLEGKREESREEVVVYDEYGPVRMIRTHESKYVHRYPYGPHELYDLQKDPGERRNLMDDKSKQPVLSEMRRRLAQWFGRYVAPRMDGARCPACGRGQRAKIGTEYCIEDSFYLLEE